MEAYFHGTQPGLSSVPFIADHVLCILSFLFDPVQCTHDLHLLRHGCFAACKELTASPRFAVLNKGCNGRNSAAHCPAPLFTHTSQLYGESLKPKAFGSHPGACVVCGAIVISRVKHISTLNDVERILGPPVDPPPCPTKSFLQHPSLIPSYVACRK